MNSMNSPNNENNDISSPLTDNADSDNVIQFASQSENEPPTNDQLDNELKELRERVESLEVSNSIVSNNTEMLLELIKIITEIPAGQQIFNRAINRQKLNRLKEIVLPRRQATLTEIVDEEMPEELKEQFVKDEMKLISSVIRVISHREHFENQAAQSVRDILTKLFTKIQKSKNQTSHKQLIDATISKKNGKRIIVETKSYKKYYKPKHGRKLVAA